MELRVGDLTFEARSAGRPGAPLVLLLHGFPQTSLSWRSVMEPIADAGYHVVAPDLRGYSPGARPPGVEAYTPDPLVSDVLGFADALGASSFHLVGHDWGGLVAWFVAGAAPGRLLTLTSVAVPHPAALANAIRTDPEQTQRSWYFEWFRTPDVAEQTMLADDAAALRASYTHSEPGDVDAYVAAMTQPGALTAAINYYRAIDYDAWTAIPPSSVPTLYVYGTDEPFLVRATADASAAFVTAPYTFVPLDGVGHWVPEQAPGRLVSLVLDHLRASA